MPAEPAASPAQPPLPEHKPGADAAGHTDIFAAIHNGDLKALRLCVARGFVNSVRRRAPHTSALAAAAFNSDADAVELLLQGGADVHYAGNVWGLYPLDVAIASYLNVSRPASDTQRQKVVSLLEAAGGSKRSWVYRSFCCLRFWWMTRLQSTIQPLVQPFLKLVAAPLSPLKWLLGRPTQQKEESSWEKGLEDEMDFWSHWFEGGGRVDGHDYSDEYKVRLAFDSVLGAPLAQPLAATFAPGSSISILDVGAGPATKLGKRLEGYDLRITAVDALADHYDHCIKKAGVTVPVRTELCQTERLLEKFATNSFEIVHCSNALDHHLDPLKSLSCMHAVTKPGGFMLLEHGDNEGEHESYEGLHNFNLCVETPEEGEPYFRLWNPKGLEVNLSEHFKKTDPAGIVRILEPVFPKMHVVQIVKG